MNKKIYLDYNATSPLLKQVNKAIKKFDFAPLNPSSIHFYGRIGKKILNEARAKIKQFLKAENAEVIFTSCATESNNLAIKGFLDTNGSKAKSIIISAVEHSSILKPAEKVAQNLFTVKVNENGVIDLNHLEEILKIAPKPALISIIYANNEIGTVQPIKQIAQFAIENGAYIHTDAVQMVGKMPINFDDLNVDMLSFSGHKFGALQGIGVLLIKKGIHLDALLNGGGQEKFLRSGTENVLGAFSILKAFEVLEKSKYPNSSLRDYLEESIKKHAPKAVIVAKDAARLPNTTTVIIPNITSIETLLINFDLKGIMLSSGSACSSGKIESSHVLKALGYSDAMAKSAIRISTGIYTTKKEIDYFLKAFMVEYEKSL